MEASTRRVLVAAAVCSVVVMVSAGCGADQNPWCARLETVIDLDELASTISEGDAGAAAQETERFSEVASEAPPEIRADMAAVADALTQVVEVATAPNNADPDDLELRREALNDQLGRVAAHVTAVSQWAETECGIRLNRP